ncbi:hypothetical protein [Oceanithermus sp.]|uniref:hypothetical protein n=1 Tax=Oceanithermus sp. TaxID=2268145 RepID=UPI00257E839F|nr:hypothetical protein [Oceanithermus sp.]
MRRAGVLLLVLLAALAAAHAGDFSVEKLRIVRTPEGVFLEGRIVYPAGDDPLELEVVATDRGEGVLELRRGDAWQVVRAVPIPYGVTNFGAATPMRIRLTGGPYRPGEVVPVTFLFPAGALMTARAVVEGSPSRAPWFSALALGLALIAYLRVKTRRRARSG